MKLHTVFITYNRLELTKRAIASYLETVTLPYSMWVVDNASTDGTQEWIQENIRDIGMGYTLFNKNRYPGAAANEGWRAIDFTGVAGGATHLQRADNDFIFLPGWCEEVEACFTRKTGQVGLRTKDEEPNGKYNVGGNCVIRRDLFDKGLRYDEKPWPEFPIGHTEDSFFSPAVKEMGFRWKRVKKPCIQSIGVESTEDPYYRETWKARGIWPSSQS